ncbi:MAG: CBS domain-containing protein [Mycobacteriales bacterium]
MRTVRDVMTTTLITVTPDSSAMDAAIAMRDNNIGPVLVVENNEICGILTDRDITVEAVASGKDLSTTKVIDLCTANVQTVSPDTSIEDAVQLMQDHSIRRLPVVENGAPVGIVSLGDLTVDIDAASAGKMIQDISADTPNN